MSNEVAVKTNAASALMVPFNPSKIKVALQKAVRESDTASVGYLKMEKTGAWVTGRDGEPVEDGAEFYLAPNSFQHGYIAWASGNTGVKTGEVMGPVEEPVPELHPLPGGSDPWQPQRGFLLVPVGGGMPLVYRTTSLGGRKLVDELWKAVIANIEATNCVPIISLDSDWYPHKKYGKVYEPKMPVAKWVPWATLQADLSAVKADKPEPAKKKAPLSRPPAKKADTRTGAAGRAAANTKGARK